MELLQALGVFQAPGPEPTLPPGPVDVPGVEVPRDAPSRGFDLLEQYGPELGVVIAVALLIFLGRRIFAAIPWKVVGPALVFVILAAYVANKAA